MKNDDRGKGAEARKRIQQSMSVTFDECAVHAEKIKISSDGGDSGSKKCIRAYGGV
jgi:hypothetical protein